jgi:hypothetical protein
MNNKILVAMIHPEEWNQYIPFDGYLKSIKNNYSKILCVVHEYAKIFITSADVIYTMKNSEMDIKYPSFLDTSVRENHFFIDRCVEEIKKDYPTENLEFVSWQGSNHHSGIVDIRYATETYQTSFKYAQEWYKSGNLVYPTEETFNKIKLKYEKPFDEKTYIILTRNFKNKANVYNTSHFMPEIDKFINHLLKNNLKIINIGFPPHNCDVINDNYVEICEDLSQDELLSLFYLSNGVLIQGNAGGFVSHFSSNIDMFVYSDQWYLPDQFESFDLISHKNKSVKSIDISKYTESNDNLELNYQIVSDILTNHKKTTKLLFSDKKETKYI